MIMLLDLAKELREVYSPYGTDWDRLPVHESDKWILIAHTARNRVMEEHRKEIELLNGLLDTALALREL